jgi:hypothetical protein
MYRYFLLLTLFFSTLQSSISKAEADLRWDVEIPISVGSQAFVEFEDRKIPIGKVIKIPNSSRYPAYTASAWGKPGKVCASAVNAIHMLLSVEKGKGRTISLIPSETVAPAATPGTAIVLEGKGGTGIFGAWAPPVGTPVTIRNAEGTERPLTTEDLPREGETLKLRVETSDPPVFVEIENHPGGKVSTLSERGYRTIAKVVRPVGGTGRFGGTLYQSVSRLRANHTGVIDISTSPYGEIGGFQIVPLKHGDSPEMASMWHMTQWMILAPLDGVPLAGNPPLFDGYLLPGPIQVEDQENVKFLSLWAKYGRRSLALCRIDGGPWRFLPESIGRNDNSLKSLTHLRIYFPDDREPLKD